MINAVRHICDHLQDRTATLFLGAGINAGLTNSVEQPFPMGTDLSGLISERILGDSNLKLTLDEASEMARFKIGIRELNGFISDLFSSFTPGVAHRSLVQLPWDVIYTTNFDLLVEAAASDPANNPAGTIAPVFSTDTDLSGFLESDVLYYKLHGSIDQSNSDTGRLILTKEDYRYYESHRKSLFKRLRNDLQRRTFVFVGYSLGDTNFRAILEDCRQELGTQTLPLSFAVRLSFGSVEEAFWREKYNIQLIDSDSSVFLASLRDAWMSQQYSVIPLDVRRTRLYQNVDPHTKFEKVAESFYRVRVEDVTGQSDPKSFFAGKEALWSDIRDEVAPRRTAYAELFEAIFPSLADPAIPNSAFLVTGAAGTGKTTLLRTIAFDLAKLEIPVFVHIPEAPFEARHLGMLGDKSQRLVVIVHHAADSLPILNRLLKDAQQLGIPLTLLLEERKNQWESAISISRSRFAPEQFSLGNLDLTEINNILDALQRHGSLNKLSGTSRSFQVDHFTALADKDLLVALRELTTNNSFDQIVTDEYNRIPSDKARGAYVFVAMLGVVNLGIRYETLLNLVDVRAEKLASEIFAPTEGVLITTEESGGSRYTAGFTIRSRHPIISSVIFAAAAPDDDSKLRFVNSLLAQLDPGYPQDHRILDALVRSKDLARMFASPEKRRAIYERLAIVLPGNAFVFQHRSILERELGNGDLAVKFARDAVQRNQMSQSFLNTLGLALELESRTANELKKNVLLFEASKIFDENVRYDPNSPFGYIGKALIIRSKIAVTSGREARAILLADGIALLSEALEFTAESPIITVELAWFRRELGDLGDIVELVRDGVKRNLSDVRLRRILVQFEQDAGHTKEALAVAMEGVKFNPASWWLHRDIARLKRALGEPTHVVKGYYDTAVRHNKGDLALLSELGAFLFDRGEYVEYQKIFRDAELLSLPGNEKTRVRDRIRQGSQLKLFRGTIKVLRGATGYVTVHPEGLDIFFWLSDSRLKDLREGQRVVFHIGFNARGAIAFDVDSA